MNKLCQFKLCYFYDPPLVTALDRNKIKQVNCNYCNTVIYCSEKCKESDWNRQHFNQCPGNPDRQVEDPQSPCFHKEPENIPEERTVDDFVVVTPQIGQGTYGYVDLVKDIYTGQLYAMKTVNKSNPVNPYTLKREATIQGKLQHKNILQLFMCFEDRESLKLILEYAENGSLAQVKHHNEETVWKYFSQICLGLNYLHSNNIIHRDLKPENILISGDTVKLSDFGWSTELERPSTKRDTICGTIDYMAPEVMYSETGYSFKVDIWSLGVILYEMLDGQVPFKESGGLQEYLQSKTKINLQGYSVEVNDLINQMLEVKSDKRIDLKRIVSHPWFVEMSKKTNFDLKGYFNDFIQHTPKGSAQFPQYMIFSSEEEEKHKEQSERSSVISVDCIDDYFKQFSVNEVDKLNGFKAQLDNFEKGIQKSDDIAQILPDNNNRTSMRYTRMSRISIRNNHIQKQQPENRFKTIWNFFSCVNREKQ